MDLSGVLKTLFKPETNQSLPMPSLKSGQIVFGRITRLFPNQTAEVQVGSQKMIAKLEIPLSADEGYWFQVQSDEGKINLKVIAEANGKGKSANPMEGLLSQLGVPQRKENIEFVRFLLKEQLPITKDSIDIAAEWMKNAETKGMALDVIKMMAQRNLPFTKEVFSSMSAVLDGKPIAQLLENALSSLNERNETNTVQQLKAVLNTVISSAEELDWGRSENTIRHIKHMVSALGMDYEKQIFERDVTSAEKADELLSLKPLLIRYLTENEGNSKKDAAEQLLNRITGLQLLSQDNGPLLQFTTQVPITFWNKTSDLSIQWNGRKKEDGKIDPHYCRVLFYLDLEYMGHTVVDMQVQNRIMTISISSEKKEMREVASPFIKLLKEKLKEMDYHLSAVTFEEQGENKSGTHSRRAAISVYENKIYGGVDYKV